MIRVNQIAQELAKLKIPLIAGQAGLDREVRYVTSIELKEKTPRIQEKGFLLSTFHAFEDAEAIVDHLQWLNGIRVSAIGFHTSVYQKIPDHVLEFSETHGLPLFRIPAETPYNLFFELFNDMRQEVREAAMKWIHQLNHLLIEAVLSKRSPSLIIDMIIDMIGEHSGGDFVVWLKSDFDVLAQWNREDIGQPAIQAFIKDIHSSMKEKLIQARIQDEPYRLHCDEAIGGFLIAFPVSSQAVFGGYLILHFNEEPNESVRPAMTEMIQTVSKILTSDVYNPEKRSREKEIQIIEQLLFGEADPHLTHELSLDLQKRYRMVLISSRERKRKRQRCWHKPIVCFKSGLEKSGNIRIPRFRGFENIN
ncbi:PucR family transcriptional regulator ligand-binding domain-containing protein [Kroppenstedtia sanguinis]|uniref:PucR family transcriptional regulator ligand-binding domain-containing protein n=1 Tax=Kroppenstedtia sanguinis TaxID=1380684 RepID=A0ABW4CCQ7_9BACL